MGLGDIFKKESKLLDSPKDLPDLASEKLGDENAIAPRPKAYFDYPEKPPKIETENVEMKQKEISVPMPNPPLQNNNQPMQLQGSHYPYPFMGYPHPMPMQYPYPVPNMQPHYPMHYPVQIPSQERNPREEIQKSHRTPLRNLLTELDEMEERWHSLTYQKRSMEKELKYLEAEIEHKLKLLKTHMVIANEESEVPAGKEFYLADGGVLRSRKDLEIASSEMSKQVFDHHVGPGWNDFSDWANNCLKEVELAAKLKKVRSPQELQAALKTY